MAGSSRVLCSHANPIPGRIVNPAGGHFREGPNLGEDMVKTRLQDIDSLRKSGDHAVEIAYSIAQAFEIGSEKQCSGGISFRYRM